MAGSPFSSRWSALGLVAWLLTAAPALGSGVLVTLPQPVEFGAPAYSLTGRRLTFDSRGPGTYGYRTVRVRLDLRQPATTDQTITLRLRAQPLPLGAWGVRVEGECPLPAGADHAELTLRVPQYTDWTAVAWDLLVDGVFDPYVSAGANTTVSHPGSGGGIAILRVRGTQPRRGDWGGERSRWFLDEMEGELSDHWLDYSALDAVCIHATDLAQQKRGRPRAWRALMRWVRAGGSLWVEGAGQGFERLAEVDGVLDLGPWRLAEPPEAQPGGPAPPSRDAPAWRWAMVPRRRSGQPPPGEPAPPTVGAAEQPEDNEVVPAWFAERPVGLGVALAYPERFFQPSDGLPGGRGRQAFRYWAQRAWVARHGLVPAAANVDYANWFIPGVGTAPVIEFAVLISLFALVVGPLNYWWLRVHHRAHLMTIVAPLCSALLTLLLVGYALLTSGIGTQVRGRSIALLDADAREVVNIARLTYFTGFASAEGVVLPGECAVYPILPPWEDSATSGGAEAERSVRWETPEPGAPLRQRLLRGWFPSRATTQVVQVSAADSSARVGFREGAALVAQNGLGAPLTLLLARDARGDWWRAGPVGAGEDAPMMRADRTEAVALLREAAMLNAPLFPEGLAPGEAVSTSLWGRDSRRRMNALVAEGPRLEEGLLEAPLVRLLGLEGGEALPLPPRSFLAVSEETAWTPLAGGSPAQTGGFHIVVGPWPGSAPAGSEPEDAP